VGYEECNVKCVESACLTLHCTGVARGSCPWTAATTTTTTAAATTTTTTTTTVFGRVFEV